MKAARISKVVLFVAILIPLSGCIGDDDAPVQSAGNVSEISDGVPPEKFTFEPVAFTGKGELTRQTRETTNRWSIPLISSGGTTYSWNFTWEISGLTPLGVGQNKDSRGEAFYQVWLARPDDNAEEGVKWEQQGVYIAKEGTLKDKSKTEKGMGEIVGFKLTLETGTPDSTPGITLMEVADIPPTDAEEAQSSTEPKQWTIDVLKPFSGAFADAKVQTLDNNKINISVTAIGLPRVEGSYDVFIQNQQGTTYLGSLKFEAAVGGHSIATQPDPTLFTRYQLSIFLESSESGKKENAHGYRVMTSKFSS